MTQLIDKKTGTIFIKGGQISLLDQFDDVCEQLGQHMKITEQRCGIDEYSIYHVQVDENLLTIRLIFIQRILKFIEIYIQFNGLEEPREWNEWTEQFEIIKKAKQNEWIDNQVGKKREFEWGTIQSVFDRKGGFSSIIIRKK